MFLASRNNNSAKYILILDLMLSRARLQLNWGFSDVCRVEFATFGSACDRLGHVVSALKMLTRRNVGNNKLYTADISKPPV